MRTWSSAVSLAALVYACSLTSGSLGLLHRATSSQELSQRHTIRTSDQALQLLRAAPGVRQRPVLTVELHGGLGNQIFQVVTLLATAVDQQPSFSVVLPNVSRVSGGNRSTYWHSIFKKLTPLLVPTENVHRTSEAHGTPQKQCVVEQTSGFDPLARNCSMATNFHSSWSEALKQHGRADCSVWTLRGYFQNQRFFGNHLPVLWRLFWDERSVQQASKRLAKLAPTGSGSALVSVHYRLGDYDPNGWVLDRDYYDQALVEVRNRLGIDSPMKGKIPRNLTCLIISDDPKRAWARSNSLDGCDQRILVPKDEEDTTSFYMMSLAEASVLADSTFSYFAGALGLMAAESGLGNKRLVMAPQIQDSPDGPCWNYMLQPILSSNISSWIIVPARTLSSPELIADEIMEYAVPPASD